MSNWEAVCDGCVTCAMRCTAHIKISEHEYTHILEVLHEQDPAYARKVLAQKKELPWFEEITYTACLFLDTDTRLCLIYPARPLICRLFGRVRHLPCPEGKVPDDFDARHLIEAYTAQPLRTFQEWMMLHGLFDFDTVLGEDADAPCFEV